MKLKKMLKSMVDFLDQDRQAQREELQTLHKLLKQLKLKEKELLERIDQAENDEQRENLALKLEVLNAQRAKGKEQLLALREERKSSHQPQPESKPETATEPEPKE